MNRSSRIAVAAATSFMLGVTLAAPVQAHAGWPGSKTTYKTADVWSRPGSISGVPIKLGDIEVKLSATWGSGGRFKSYSASIRTHETVIGMGSGAHVDVYTPLRVRASGPGRVDYRGVVRVLDCAAYVTPICPVDARIQVDAYMIQPRARWETDGTHPDSAYFHRSVTCASDTVCRIAINLGGFQ